MPDFDGAVTAIALCWRLERGDGAGVALTSHDQPLVRDGVLHCPSPGIAPAALTHASGLEPQSSEVRGALSASALEAADLMLGRWDGARATLTACDWENAESAIPLVVGELGTVAIEGDGFTADLLGTATKLSRPVCPSTSPGCRAEFGDKRCRVDLAGRTRVARVVGCSGRELTLDEPVDDRLVRGRLRYLAGENCGVATVITAVSGATVTIRDLPRMPIEAGVRIALREGCDKQFATCVDRFSNAANFRGEPHLPGADRLTRYPGL